MDEGEARVGTRLGSYLIQGVIGRGGMGTVYRAEHVYLQKAVAVKVLHRSYFDQPQAIQRFLREAQNAGRIDHPNIVGITDFGEAPDGTVFLVMAHVDGISLERLLRNEKRLPLFRTLVILAQVTRALDAAHSHSIIHHDLKPDNIMLEKRAGRREVIRQINDDGGSLIEPEGPFDFVTILDFGASKYMDQATSSVGVVIGTPTFMAPETARDGIADGRSDIYAVGVIFYEMLTGTVPFDGDKPVDIMLKHVREPVPPPRLRCPQAEITPLAEATMMKALAKDPAQRQQTMRELHADLERCYGAVKFRRSVQPLPEGMPVESLRKAPIPLTQVKRRPSDGTHAAVASASAAIPVPEGQRDPEPVMPVMLTRRRSGKHRTLPFGVETSPPATPDDVDVDERRRR